jgi:hypothetical protein
LISGSFEKKALEGVEQGLATCCHLHSEDMEEGGVKGCVRERRGEGKEG